MFPLFHGKMRKIMIMGRGVVWPRGAQGGVCIYALSNMYTVHELMDTCQLSSR
jgi:hypothetical protein